MTIINEQQQKISAMLRHTHSFGRGSENAAKKGEGGETVVLAIMLVIVSYSISGLSL